MNNADQFELPGAEAAFNLAGEETIDGARVQAEAEAAAQAAADAKAKQDREQLSLSEQGVPFSIPAVFCTLGEFLGESRESGKHEAQTLTPYQKTKAAGIKSSFYSPDGFCKIEEFENGARFLHDPLIGYPVSLRPNKTT